MTLLIRPLIDMQKMHVFYVVALYENLSKASQILNLSVSSVSRHVTDLEQRLNVMLFVREARGLVLTPEGKVLFQGAAQILQQLHGLTHKICGKEGRALGALRIACDKRVLELVTTKFIRPFEKENPGIVTQVDATPSNGNFEAGDVSFAPFQARGGGRVQLYVPGLSDAHDIYFARPRSLEGQLSIRLFESVVMGSRQEEGFDCP